MRLTVPILPHTWACLPHHPVLRFSAPPPGSSPSPLKEGGPQVPFSPSPPSAPSVLGQMSRRAEDTGDAGDQFSSAHRTMSRTRGDRKHGRL